MFALLAVSCQKGTDGPNDGRTQLTIKLGDGSGNTRSVESPGLTVGLTLTDGHIFVINNVGSVIYDVALDIAAAYGSSGQKLMDKTNTSDPLRVSSDSRVYVLGNIPASVNVASLSSWSQIEAATSRIVYDKTTPANSLNTDYTKAPVANESGQPENITVTGSQGSVAINLVPLYTRLEIAKITGTGNITAFRVAGVYIDKYYDTFTMTGGVPAAAVAWDLQQGTVFTDNIGDVGRVEGFGHSRLVGTPDDQSGTGQAVGFPPARRRYARHHHPPDRHQVPRADARRTRRDCRGVDARRQVCHRHELQQRSNRSVQTRGDVSYR